MAKKKSVNVSKRDFCRTVFTIEVLSEDYLPDHMNPSEIWEECLTGAYSGDYSKKVQPVDALRVVRLLKAQGSDPSFFRLTSKGEDVEDTQL